MTDKEERREQRPEEAGEHGNGQPEMSLPEYLRHYLTYLVKWILLAGVIGTISGFVGALFYRGVAGATALREQYPFLLYFLPAAGLFIVWTYKMLGSEGASTDTIIEAAREGHEIHIGLLPSIFSGTVLTHLTGGSAGREGAALQIGGSIGNQIGRILKLSREEMKIATMAGMASFFSAIFGTPLTASMFVILFISVGTFYEVALLPSYLAALIARGVASLFGAEVFQFAIEVPEMVTHHFVRVLVLAALSGVLSVIFCSVLHETEALYKKLFHNAYVRVLVGAGLIIALTLIEGSGDYNGAGGGVIARALSGEQIAPYAFVMKLLFTALTLGAGFKGGEIVPTFFVGATFGAVVGPLLGIPSSFGAAVGMIAMFAGVTNTVIASIFLAIEAFSGVGVLYFALACIVSYACSGYNGLYSSQRILYSKTRPAYINLRTNHNHLVNVHASTSKIFESAYVKASMFHNKKKGEAAEDKQGSREDL